LPRRAGDSGAPIFSCPQPCSFVGGRFLNTGSSNDGFHGVLRDACPNRTLIRLLASLGKKTLRFRRMAMSLLWIVFSREILSGPPRSGEPGPAEGLVPRPSTSA
jgi:hypothetical protein